ncbi:MAG TPA: hypothetical protein DD727_03995 [Clostridiales bacterium]|nr:hypothetical protein [Clostridiales bacterium]
MTARPHNRKGDWIIMNDHRPLTRNEMKSVIEGRGAAHRVPMIIHFWTGAKTFGENEQKAQQLLQVYPNDLQVVGIRMPQVYKGTDADPEYRWVNYDAPLTAQANAAHDAQVAIPDWDLLDGIIENFPKAAFPDLLPGNPPDDGRYRAGHWWYWLFERHWSLRGMNNALTDYYTDPDNVHRLYRALTDFYKAAITRAKAERNLDAIITSDDIGTQTGPFFSLDIFREFFKPYYKELIWHAHSLGMHFWLHACGNIAPFLPDLIEIGLDVIHPIQKYTMEEKHIAQTFGNDITIWAGFDVQRTIPYGTPEDVRREVRFMMDTYARADGRFMITAGNGITADCKVESLEALLDESLHYGTEVIRKVLRKGRTEK